jgi:hypothetical protein
VSSDEREDEARRLGRKAEKPPRRQHLAETLRAAGKCDRCPPHSGPDNAGRRSRK